MANYDLTRGQALGTEYGGSQTQIAVVKAVLDFTKTPGAASDTFKLIPIPAGHVLDMAAVVTDTPEGAACVGSLGDSLGVATLIAAGGVNANGAAGSGVVATVKTNVFYASGDYIQFALGANGATKGKLIVTAKFVRVNNA